MLVNYKIAENYFKILIWVKYFFSLFFNSIDHKYFWQIYKTLSSNMWSMRCIRKFSFHCSKDILAYIYITSITLNMQICGWEMLSALQSMYKSNRARNVMCFAFMHKVLHRIKTSKCLQAITQGCGISMLFIYIYIHVVH